MTSPARIETTVVVAGAGPAGAACAITLARAGVDVLLVDKAVFPRDKTCGDGLTALALRHLEALGLEPASVASWTPVHGVELSSPSRAHWWFPLPRGNGEFAVIARRIDLDAAILDLARKAGAVVREGVAVRDVQQGRDHVEIVLADGSTVVASHLVGADGAWSPTKKLLNAAVPGYRGEWHAFRQYFSGVSPSAAASLLVWFEPDFLPGYAWSFPVGDGRVNFGFGIQRGASYDVGDMAPLWRDLLARPHIRAALGPDAEPEGPHRAWPIPANVEAASVAQVRALWVGDAIGAADPLTGEGIGQALASGVWAAEAILGDRGDPAAIANRYRARVAGELHADARMSRLLVGAMRHRKGARFAIRIAGTTAWTRRNFARWLFEDYPRAALVTPRRWHRTMFSAPGPYRPRR